ncbi:MAG: bile acid:sodium symporter family protein [Pseudorhodoplanes sp.]
MRELVIDYGVPFSLFVLMTIVGTELVREDLRRAALQPRAVLSGVAGQLLVLPPLVLLIAALIGLDHFLTTSLLLLSVCPGGAISNTYSYLARCNVSLAATITTAGTLCSLISIPLWLAVVARWMPFGHEIVTVPTLRILSQLLFLMVLPLALGAAARRRWPVLILRMGRHLRWASLVIVFVILLAATWSVRDDLHALAVRIALSATLFILGAMLLGWLLAYGLPPRDAPVLVIESAVRNVGIAALIGRILFNDTDFGTFGGLLTGYFIIEVAIMLVYAHILRIRPHA